MKPILSNIIINISGRLRMNNIHTDIGLLLYGGTWPMQKVTGDKHNGGKYDSPLISLVEGKEVVTYLPLTAKNVNS
jgi:hypothetical protein